jgi:uncharacterized membrane protein
MNPDLHGVAPSVLVPHVVAGVLALAAGVGVFVATKGTRRHRAMGWTYAGAMFAVCASSFWIGGYDSGASISFHILSAFNIVMLALGVGGAMRRRTSSRWFRAHYFFMLYSYFGLVMATDSHLLRMLPGRSLLVKGLVLWGLPWLLARRWIQGRYEDFAARFGERRRPAAAD